MSYEGSALGRVGLVSSLITALRLWNDVVTTGMAVVRRDDRAVFQTLLVGDYSFRNVACQQNHVLTFSSCMLNRYLCSIIVKVKLGSIRLD